MRALGRDLGIPEAIVGPHPFAGPGLAIRMPGEITRAKLELLRNADAIFLFLEEIRAAGFMTRSGRRSPCCCRCAPSV